MCHFYMSNIFPLSIVTTFPTVKNSFKIPMNSQLKIREIQSGKFSLAREWVLMGANQILQRCQLTRNFPFSFPPPHPPHFSISFLALSPGHCFGLKRKYNPAVKRWTISPTLWFFLLSIAYTVNVDHVFSSHNTVKKPWVSILHTHTHTHQGGLP